MSTSKTAYSSLTSRRPKGLGSGEQKIVRAVFDQGARMEYALSDDHHMAVCGRDLVLLNSRKGDYSLIASGADVVTLEGRRVDVVDGWLLNSFIDAGVLVDPAATATLIHALPRRPTRSAIARAKPPVRIVDAVATGFAWAQVGRTFAQKSFAELLAAAGPTPSQAPVTEEMLRRAWAFDQLTPWIPFQGACLYRCALLLRRLRPSSERPHWVFGIRSWPFIAHCWLQADDVVLTDYAETLAVFTPIFAI